MLQVSMSLLALITSDSANDRVCRFHIRPTNIESVSNTTDPLGVRYKEASTVEPPPALTFLPLDTVGGTFNVSLGLCSLDLRLSLVVLLLSGGGERGRFGRAAESLGLSRVARTQARRFWIGQRAVR
jgi:hypothetical protein